MDHRLVSGIEHALGWNGPTALGTRLARGRLAEECLPERIMTPHRLLDLIMCLHLSNPQLRMYACGDELHPSMYLSDILNRRRQLVGRPTRRPSPPPNGGASLALDSVDTFDPSVQVACRALGWWSGELVSANVYIAVGDTAGFALYWDDHDVLCVQLAGSKSWQVREPTRPHPMYRDAEQTWRPAAKWSGPGRCAPAT